MGQSMSMKPTPTKYELHEKRSGRILEGVAIAVGSVILAASAGAASAEQSEINCHSGEVTTIDYGDTLWAKAEEIQANMTDPHSVDTGQIVVELKEENNMELAELRAGQKLRTVVCE